MKTIVTLNWYFWKFCRNGLARLGVMGPNGCGPRDGLSNIGQWTIAFGSKTHTTFAFSLVPTKLCGKTSVLSELSTGQCRVWISAFTAAKRGWSSARYSRIEESTAAWIYSKDSGIVRWLFRNIIAKIFEFSKKVNNLFSINLLRAMEYLKNSGNSRFRA